ncbi:unnamed protein product [Adineta ricciae]|uniref:Uncharacterized protein n=1 Tax=Adineta ricciae TaxID=249248 RepID=A0A816C4G6_ADIRI|nr:unnamed protein product [Adineta ricciae]
MQISLLITVIFNGFHLDYTVIYRDYSRFHVDYGGLRQDYSGFDLDYGGFHLDYDGLRQHADAFEKSIKNVTFAPPYIGPWW